MGAAIQTGNAGKNKLKPIINVTPLVDVVLVLLIIFMVIIPNMQEGKTIEMVQVKNPDDGSDQQEPVIVTIDRKQVYTLDEADMTREAVLTELRTLHGAAPKRKILLRGDATLRYQVMREFFREVQEIGFGGVALAVAVTREWTPAEEG